MSIGVTLWTVVLTLHSKLLTIVFLSPMYNTDLCILIDIQRSRNSFGPSLLMRRLQQNFDGNTKGIALDYQKYSPKVMDCYLMSYSWIFHFIMEVCSLGGWNMNALDKVPTMGKLLTKFPGMIYRYTDHYNSKGSFQQHLPYVVSQARQPIQEKSTQGL